MPFHPFVFLVAPALAGDAGSEDPGADAPDRDELLRDVEAFLGAEEGASEPPPPPPAPVANPATAFNPRVTAFGDALAVARGAGGAVDPASGPHLRSAELDIRADVDPFAKAVAVLTFEQDLALLESAGHDDGALEEGPGGGFEASPEEVYVDLVALPAGLSARAGRFLLPFGVTSRMHPHDWPWPTAPLAMQHVVGPHGLSDAGATVTWRLSAGSLGALTLDAGAVRGDVLDPDGATALPAALGRAELFEHVGAWEVGLGASGLALEGERLAVADLLVRWKRGIERSFLLVAEAFARDGAEGRRAGATATLQVQPRRGVYLGLRGAALDDGDLGAGAFASYYTSEFLRVRGGAEWFGASAEWLGTLQLTFVWGSHPVEPYWVNR